MFILRPFSLLLIPLSFTLQDAAIAQSFVEAKKGYWEEAYTDYETMTLDDRGIELPASSGNLSRFGGDLSSKHKATGYFRTHYDGEKWTMVDPDGYEWYHVGCNSVYMSPTQGGKEALKKHYGSPENWEKTINLELQDIGFNLLANWSNVPRGPDIPKMPYVIELGVMQEFGKSLGVAKMGYGHHKYEGDVMPVFHPKFPDFARSFIEKNFSHVSNDPWLVGYFSDNELPLHLDVLEKYLALPKNNPNRQAVIEWLEGRGFKTVPETLGEALKSEFLEHVVSTYFRIVSESLRAVDPNHLLLGCRFLAHYEHIDALWKGAGPFLDVVSLNLYGIWTPTSEQMNRWVTLSGKPFFITEWYSKGMDSGLPNKGGAGWTVKTQTDRAKHYEHFTLLLLEHPGCVGWHWFKYQDNDPENNLADTSNLDANKGFVNNRYEPYTELIDSMKKINRNVYWLRERLLVDNNMTFEK